MIRLHHVPQSRSMRSLWLLHELGVDFEVVIHPFDKSLRDPAYLAVSPAGRVPALEIDGGHMCETGAITEYLCETFPDAGMGRAVGDPERMQWLVWVHFAETISQHAAALTQQHIAIYPASLRSPVVMKLEAARIAKCYDAIEATLTGSGRQQDYLLPSGFSAADISVGQAVYMGLHFRTLDSHPAVAAWYARLQQRPGFQASLPKPDERLFKQDFFEPMEMPV